MSLTIITRQTLHHGLAQLIIYRTDGAYQVALIDAHQRLVRLPDATFWTYDTAHERLQVEWRQRTAPPQKNALAVSMEPAKM